VDYADRVEVEFGDRVDLTFVVVGLASRLADAP
jgi:hypothetical protein